ncbi:MAG: sulfur carrier protein ThiS [Gemmatimonadaceae bacterium]|nr:sulfur carrier protein ThiS [Gemmatimonadaceae bacterium]
MSSNAIPSNVITPLVNGEARAVPAGSTVGDLLRSLALDPRMVVVEHNRTILRDRSAYDTITLSPADTIEIVHFVGGG